MRCLDYHKGARGGEEGETPSQSESSGDDEGDEDEEEEEGEIIFPHSPPETFPHLVAFLVDRRGPPLVATERNAPVLMPAGRPAYCRSPA
jgi:hypothetical protein